MRAARSHIKKLIAAMNFKNVLAINARYSARMKLTRDIIEVASEVIDFNFFARVTLSTLHAGAMAT